MSMPSPGMSDASQQVGAQYAAVLSHRVGWSRIRCIFPKVGTAN